MPRISATVVRTVAIGLGAVILVILLLVSTGGRLDVVQRPAHASAPVAAAGVSAPVTGAGRPQGSGDLAPVAIWAGILLLAAFVVGGIVAWILLLRRVAGGRRRSRSDRPAAAPDVLLDAVAEDSAEHLSALRHGAPREAIIGCWASLEATMRRIGLAPDAAETSTELVQRALSAYPIEHGTIHRLAALYREARFSTHRIPETSRALAIASLERLHAELAGVRRAERPLRSAGGHR